MASFNHEHKAKVEEAAVVATAALGHPRLPQQP